MERKKTRKINKIKKDTNKKINKQPKQVSIFTILFILGIVALCIGIYFGVRYLVITLKYKQYTDKMIDYGYNELYDNQKATSVQTVSNAELIKVVIGAITNNKDVSSMYYLASDSAAENENWYEYSRYLGLNEFTSKDKLNNKAKVIDAVLFTIDTLESLTDVELEQATLKMSEKRLEDYTENERQLISKAVALGVISNKTASLSNKAITKGELNKLVITIVERFATMHVEDNASIVKDKEKLPENYKEYPYIVDTIGKEVYEYDYKIITKSNFANPKETYKIMGYLNEQTAELIKRYFSKILNIDYETISTKSFLDSITNEVAYLLEEEDVQAYVDYVKEHKIKLEGSAMPLLPIMYNNGEQYVVRTKIQFKVLSSDTEYNLLFGDEDSSVKYTSKEITMYVDVPTIMTFNSRSLLVYITTLANEMPNQNSMVIVEK